MRVRPLSDPDQVRGFLETDRNWAAYALADLEPDLLQLSEWHVADDGDPCALALLFRGFDPPVLFSMGDPRGVGAILSDALRAPRIYLSVRDEHMPAIRAHYRLEVHEPMWRMTLNPDEFCPATGEVIALTPDRAEELSALFTLGGGDAFTPGQMAARTFFGVEVDDRLVAVAGTHVFSERYSTAAVGNVFTRPEHRGRGYASLTTSAVCAELIRRGIRTIVLNVAQANPAAIRVYAKLGFKKVVPFNEGIAVRHSSN
jgi:ribosomal protein S18 acetylase RimI-like enzyme